MNCPTCQHHAEVRETRSTVVDGKSAVRRRRHCRKCGNRVTTIEIMVGSGNAYQRLSALTTVLDRLDVVVAHVRAALQGREDPPAESNSVLDQVDVLLGHVDGINDERDSVPILLALRDLWPRVKSELRKQ